MECLKYKPVHNYSRVDSSKVYYNGYNNCCLISSFQIQMKKIYSDFPSLYEILPIMFSTSKNAYCHFALEFPEKWFILKNHLIKKNNNWEERLDKIVIRFYLPLTGKEDKNNCVLLSVIDINKINSKEVSNGNTESLEEAISDYVDKDKITIDILQVYNHFEPIKLGEKIRDRSESIECSINKSFFN